MQNPYQTLGLPKDAGAAALEARYQELKYRYQEERFLPGEAGNLAAAKLSELEEAWEDISVELESDRRNTAYGSGYGYIDELIKQGKFDEAQALLDAEANRTAEWHYLQSIIFYRREWIADSKAQLELAVSMDPFNQKYALALERMKTITGNPNADPRGFGGAPGQPPPGYEEPPRGPNCFHCCMAYLCTDCLCHMCCG
ncbi:MAG: hypothetical protein FWD58_03195 [Firmicutes bacterium]|nr:hypothetical protein [Bacillota bacterium]